VGHRYTTSVVFTVEGKADQSDDVRDTVDYGAAADIIQRVATSTRFATVERLAREIGEELLKRFDNVRRIQLKVAKRGPPMAQIAASAGVELNLER